MTDLTLSRRQYIDTYGAENSRRADIDDPRVLKTATHVLPAE
jgi:hypothetical protein